MLVLVLLEVELVALVQWFSYWYLVVVTVADTDTGTDATSTGGDEVAAAGSVQSDYSVFVPSWCNFGEF